MKMLDLFSGIGGFSLAASWVWGDELEIVAFCEMDKFCQDEVLKVVWPDVPIIDDIRSLDEKTLADTDQRRCFGQRWNGIKGQTSNESTQSCQDYRIDLITGGFPCQPASVAGKRQGTTDDRWLWPEMFRVIKIFKPTWIIVENVAGLASLVQFDSELEVDSKEYTPDEAASGCFDVGRVCERIGRGVLEEIMGDLRIEGYEVQPFIIPACGVNAPHRRDRVWIVAHAESKRPRRESQKFCQKDGRPDREMCGKSQGSSQADWQETNEWSAEPRLGGSPDGIPNLNDGWPAACGEDQYEWEPPRICKGKKGDKRKERLQALGNAIVPQVAYMIMQAIKEPR